MKFAVGLTIREVSRATGASVHTLRYYEQAGLMLEVPRRPNGHRAYGAAHVRWIRFLRNLRKSGMSIESVRRYARFVQEGESGIPARVRLLEEHRDNIRLQITGLSEHLEVVEGKIQRFRDAGVACGPEP